MYAYLTHNPNIQGASIRFDLSSYSCNVPTSVSKRFTTFCWLLIMLAFIHLLWNSIPFAIYSCSHCRTRIAIRICSFHQPTKQQLNVFQNKWDHYELNHSRQQHDIQCTTWSHASIPDQSQRNWQGRLIVIGHTLISSEWTLITAHNHILHHDVDLYPIPWKSSHSGGSSSSALLLQYSNITPNRRLQSLQSRRCCLLPPQPPQVIVIPAPLAPGPL